MKNITPKFMSVKDFARYSGLGQTFIRERLYREGFPAFRPDNSRIWLIETEAAAAWLKGEHK